MAKEATGKTKRRILTLLKQWGPTDSAELAQHLGCSAMAVRQHLYKLQDEGMVTYREEARSLGRPVKRWQLTSAADQYFPEAYAELTLSLLQALSQTWGEAGLDHLLTVRTQHQVQDYQHQLAPQSSLSDRVKALAEIRTREGYMAETQTLEDGSLLLIENHCPICVAAQACTGLCAQEFQVFQQVLGADVAIERAEHLINGDRRCVYRIHPPSQVEQDPTTKTDTECHP